MTAKRRPLLSHALAGALALAGLPGVSAQADTGPDLTRIAAFIELVRSNGCTITEAESEALLPPAGLVLDDAYDAVALLNRGALFEVHPDGETLEFLPVLCEADAAQTETLLQHAAAVGPTLLMLSLPERIDPARAAEFVALVRAEGCALTPDQADRLLPLAGFFPEEVSDIVTLLMDAGEALPDDSGGLRFMPALCDGSGVPDGFRIRGLIRLAALDHGLVPWPEDPAAVVSALEDKLRERSCVLDISEPDIALPAIAEGLARRLGAAAPVPEAIASVLDLALGEADPVFYHEAGHLRLAACSP